MSLNNLGGDMPQERLDRIKKAWMARYGKTEADWVNFKSATGQVEYTDSIADDNELEHPFSPSCEEMGFRYRARASYHSRMAEKYGQTPVGTKNLRDAEFYQGLSKKFMDRHQEIIRKIQGKGV